MSKVEEFREAVNTNEDWQEEVRNFGADDNIVSYASGKGFDFTEDEYSEYVGNLGDELSLFEMELVSGGGKGGILGTGFAKAPPGMGCIIGVSTSTNARASRKERMKRIISVRTANTRRVSSLTIRST